MQKITTGQPLQHPTPWVYIVLHLRNRAFFPTRNVISYCSVHFDARQNHERNVIQPFSGIHDFVQRVARYGGIPPRCVIDDFVQRVARYDSFIFKAFDGARFTACADNQLI